jgi:predicted nucleic acid-binding protein
VIVADTSAIVALIHKADAAHEAVLALYQDDPNRWVLPWAIVAEVAYLIGRYGGPRVEQVFLDDLAAANYDVDWGQPGDLRRAAELNRQHPSLELGLVDTVVMAMAERLKAEAIATLDRRHFGAVTLRGAPALVPEITRRR